MTRLMMVVFAAAVTAFAFMSTAVTGQVNPPSAPPFETEGDFEESPSLIPYRFVATDGSDIRVVISVRVREGRASWVLRDPTGRNVLSGHVTRGRGAGDTGVIEAVDGVWQLTISNEDARGSYAVVYRENGDA